MVEVGSLSARTKIATKVFVRRVFAIFATNASFLCVIANSFQYNMQYVPCNKALFSQETLFLTQISTFWPKVFQKVRKTRQIIISRRYSVCWGLKFSSESKLFGEGPLCLRTTSATLYTGHGTMRR